MCDFRAAFEQAAVTEVTGPCELKDYIIHGPGSTICAADGNRGVVTKSLMGIFLYVCQYVTL